MTPHQILTLPHLVLPATIGLHIRGFHSSVPFMEGSCCHGLFLTSVFIGNNTGPCMW